MSISGHFGIILLVVVGVATIIGVIAIAVVETRRMEKGQPSIISSKRNDKAEEES